MGDLLHEVKYALRMIGRSPGFTAVALLTLGLGMGASTAIFSVVHGVLLRPLPYPQPDRLITIWETNLKQGADRFNASYPNFLEW
ncbi:MAG TPA: hypothetical protein VLA20_00380, partial [Vicinamibacterales bacterium]|nr:hypothetical protein [Vicinamibacterales bacterium]